MNRLITTNTGGFPLRLNDLRFIDESVRNVFNGIIKTLISYNIDSAILTGCEITISPDEIYTCSEGYVFFRNEIFFVEAHEIALTSDFVFFDEDISYQPDGTKTFENGDTHETYEVRKAKLYTDESLPPGALQVTTNTNNFLSIMKSNLGLPASDVWTVMTLSSANVEMSNATLDNIKGTAKWIHIGNTFLFSFNLSFDVLHVNTELSLILSIMTNFASPFQSDHQSLIYNSAETPDVYSLHKLLAPKDDADIRICPLAGSFLEQSYEFCGQLFFEIM